MMRRSNRSGRIGRIVRPDELPMQLRLRTIRPQNGNSVRCRGQRTPGPTGRLRFIGTCDGLDRGPTPFVQNAIDHLAATANNQPVAGNTSDQVMELGFDRGEVWKDIGMVVFEVIDHCCFGTVMNELGPLVEKG